ncbi:MAG: hypothetical protein IJ725_02145 [Ruminococcus sp.]|nr:hypothetical protein [Ruminococcus sp.]
MLELYGITAEQSRIELEGILSLTVNQEENVPADDLCVTVSYNYGLPELHKLILKEDGEILYTGIVDEQQTVINDSTAYNRIIARSMAALLLDSESAPVCYYQPSPSVILKYHMEPVGIKKYKGKNIAAKELFNIPKGSTNWQAVESFSKLVFGGNPRVEADGTVNFNGVKNDNVIKFSDTGGIEYNSIKENYKRCKILSNIRVKLQSDSGYDFNIKNENADSLIKRERYLDASVTSASVDIAEKMIEKGNTSSYELELTTPRRLLNILGSKAVISDSVIGERKDLYVSSVYYRLTPSGELTTVKLKKES